VQRGARVFSRSHELAELVRRAAVELEAKGVLAGIEADGHPVEALG